MQFCFCSGYGTRSSESGCDSDSSDKRAPGCERRERRRERELEQEQQENQEGGDPKELQSAPYGEDYDQKKFLATKGILDCFIYRSLDLKKEKSTISKCNGS